MNSSDKREKFFSENSDIYDMYKEIKYINAVLKGQNERGFAEIKQYAIDNTKFYSRYTISDKFPIMTKLDFINNYDEIKSDEKFDMSLHRSSTSGSTGIPFVVQQNYEKRRRTIADLKVYGEYAEYASHEKMLQLRAYNGKELDRTVDNKENIWRYDISNLSDSDIDNLIKFILEWKPVTIFGYTSTLETICNYIINSEKEYNFGVVSVLVGAETLTDEIASKIKKVFRCSVYDRYSNMEMGIYAQRKHGETNFRINKASYYFEILKLNDDTPADEGDPGRIVITDLYNHAFPMIRYDTGDLGKYCYNGGEFEITEVYGRRVDCIYDSEDNMISPHSITNKMWGIKNIQQWQFIQKAKGNYLIKIIKINEVDEEELINRLKSVLGNSAIIDIEYIQTIPVMSSSKRKYILNERKD